MSNELKSLFLAICVNIGMPTNDPIMYAYVINNIDQIQQDFIDKLYIILNKEEYILQNGNTKEQWLEDIQTHAIHIFSELLKATTNVIQPKHVRVKLGSERYNKIKENLRVLLAYANTLNSSKVNANLNADYLIKHFDSLIDEDLQIVADQNFSKTIDLVLQKNRAIINLRARENNPTSTIVEIAKITNPLLDSSKKFLLSLSNRTIYGYSDKLLNDIKLNINLPHPTIIISQHQQQEFFKNVNRRLSITSKASKIEGLLYIMKIVGTNDVKTLLKAAHKKDYLLNKLLRDINTRHKLNETDKISLMSDPALLFNIVMKLAIDNVLENLNAGSLGGLPREKYFSAIGIDFSSKSLNRIYFNVLKALDYKTHIQKQPSRFINIEQNKPSLVFSSMPLSKHEKDALRDYKLALEKLTRYADVMINFARESCIPDIDFHINELTKISRQLHSVNISGNNKVTWSMAVTLINITEKVIKISDSIEVNAESTSSNYVQRFFVAAKKFMGQLLERLLKLFESIIMLPYSYKQHTQPDTAAHKEKIETASGRAARRYDVLNNVQKIVISNPLTHC